MLAKGEGNFARRVLIITRRRTTSGYGSSPNTERNSRKRTPDKSEDLALRGLQSLTCHAPRNHIYLAVVPRENCSGLVEENQVLKEQLRDAQHRVSLLERQLQR